MNDSTATRPLTAVVILNWNGSRLLREFLPQAIANTSPDYGRIIVADNGSSDDSRRILAEEFPDVETILFDRNYGFAEGYNMAIASLTDYRYTVLLNSDVAPDKGWLEILTAYMEANRHVAACQPKILSYKNPSHFEYAGASGGYLDRNGYPYCRGRIFADCEEDRGQYNTATEIFWASGAALMVRTKAYLDAGGLDPEFFAHMEEIDLCWRMALQGHTIACVPTASVRHLGGGSLPAENPRKTYLNFRNNLLMLHKNLPESCCRRKLLWRRILDTAAWANFAVRLDFANAAAIVRAHRDFARMRRKYTSHPAENLLASTPHSRLNILTAYYLQRKRRYSQLFKKVQGQ